MKNSKKLRNFLLQNDRDVIFNDLPLANEGNWIEISKFKEEKKHETKVQLKNWWNRKSDGMDIVRFRVGVAVIIILNQNYLKIFKY